MYHHAINDNTLQSIALVWVALSSETCFNFMFSACSRKCLLMSFQTWWFKWISQFFLFWQACKFEHSQIYVGSSKFTIYFNTLTSEWSPSTYIGFKISINFSFIGISQSILATSYVKWIDVWMTFIMVVPFLEARDYKSNYIQISLRTYIFQLSKSGGFPWVSSSRPINTERRSIGQKRRWSVKFFSSSAHHFQNLD